jgi:hypothetical protein
MADPEKLQAALAAAHEAVQGLEAKKARAEREAERLRAAKGPMLQALSTNDRAGQRHLREMNAKIAEQELLIGDSNAAIEQAGAQLSKIEAELENSGRVETADKLEELAGQWRATAVRADEALDTATASFAECDRIATEMARLAQRSGCGELFNDFALRNPGPRVRAMHRAGLRRFIPELGHCGERHKVAYVETIAGANLDRVIADLRGGEGEKAEAA